MVIIHYDVDPNKIHVLNSVFAAMFLTVKKLVKSVAVSEYQWKFLVTFTKMYSDSHYLPQISLPFHQVFLQ